MEIAAVQVKAFSQRDPRWQAVKLGTGEPTLGQAGCLVSAVASMLATWGVATDPLRLNEYLLRNYGYVDDNLFVFASVDGLGCRFGEFIDCWTKPAPVERLVAAVAAGAGVIACVDFQPGGKVQPHWVQVTALTATGGRIVDPWQLPGQEQVDLAQYLAKGWTPGRGIYLAAVYVRVNGQRAAWRSARGTEAHQPMVCVRDGDDGDDAER